jgi:phosphoglycolate phosphatase
MKCDTFIFDLDGTLLDTLADLAGSCNYALRTNGMPERTIDEVRRFRWKRREEAYGKSRS